MMNHWGDDKTRNVDFVELSYYRQRFVNNASRSNRYKFRKIGAAF